MRNVIVIVFCAIVFSACDTSQKSTQGSGNTRWPDFLREWAADYEINDPQRVSLINLIDSVYCFFEDTTLSAESYSEQVCRMMERMAEVIENDSVFEFTLMMRATARNIAGRMPVDNRLLSDCVIELMMIDCRWQTFSYDTLDFMGTSLFYNSWQALGRKVNIIFFKSDNDENVYAEMIFTNLVDTAMDNLSVLFLQDRDTLIALTNDDILYVDNSDAYAGVKRALVSPSFLIDAMLSTNTIIISYDTPNEHIEYISYPQIHFEEQVKKCPRLKKIVDQMIDDIEILK